MNEARLLEHFDRISEAPDALPRLRRFILDLAVRGKLVEQDPNDEPACALLKQIRAGKGLSAADGKTQQASSTLVDPDEIPFSIPTGWQWSRFIDVASIESNLVNPKTYPDSPHIAPDNIESGTGRLLAHETIRAAGVFSAKHLFYKGQILYSKIRPALAKVAIANCDGLCSADMYPIRALVDLAYLHKYMLSEAFVQQSVAEDTRVAMPKINKASLSRILVAVPPLVEQRRIAARVDELAALCDRLGVAHVERERRRDRLVAASLHPLNRPVDDQSARGNSRFASANLHRLTTRAENVSELRQAVLNLAVGGWLVPQDSGDEPARDLLNRSLAEKERHLSRGRSKHARPVREVRDDEEPFPPPDGWTWTRLEDLLLGDSQNGYSRKPDDAVNGVPILRISAGTIRRDGIVAEEEHKRISSVSPDLRMHYGLQRGDLLACRFNGNRAFVGRLSLYTDYLGLDPIYPDKLIRLRLLSEFFLPKFVRYFAQSTVIRNDIERYCATTVGNWGISASNLKEVMIPVPPLAEQARIIARLDELMAVFDRLEAQLTNAQAASRRLLEAVLHEALESAGAAVA